MKLSAVILVIGMITIGIQFYTLSIQWKNLQSLKEHKQCAEMGMISVGHGLCAKYDLYPTSNPN